MILKPNSRATARVGDVAAMTEKRAIEVESEPHGVAIRPIGYGQKLAEDGFGSPVFIEIRDGVPFVIVWDDINDEEPSHMISLEKAAESKRLKMND